MGRPERGQLLMRTAEVWAERSTCDRLHVGCVISRDGRILVQGYNGAPAGLPHCNHDCDCKGDFPYNLKADNGVTQTIHDKGCPAGLPCTRAVHAEQNAIAFAARYGVGLEGAEMYVTHQPCLPCAMSTINAGVQAVYFKEEYRLQDGILLLKEAGIKVLRMRDLADY